ncbi:glycosyltransferase family protein [Humibacter ginsengisoli]
MSKRRVIAIVSLYRPDKEALANVSRIAAQADEVIAVDDGSGDEYESIVEAIAGLGVFVLSSSENEGIGAALNRGISHAAPGIDDVVITFDQDSVVPVGFIDALIDTLCRSTADGLKVGMVAPASFGGISQTGSKLSDGFTEALRPIQSGLLVTGMALRTVGDFDADFFIDLVDDEYYFRARAAGFLSVASADLDLPHRLGSFRTLRILGVPITTTLSTPFRYYYRSRNRILLSRRYRSSSPGLILRDSALDAAHFVAVLLFARPRRSMLTVLWRGLRDARLGRTGRIPPEVAQIAARIAWRGRPHDSSDGRPDGTLHL